MVIEELESKIKELQKKIRELEAKPALADLNVEAAESAREATWYMHTGDPAHLEKPVSVLSTMDKDTPGGCLILDFADMKYDESDPSDVFGQIKLEDGTIYSGQLLHVISTGNRASLLLARQLKRIVQEFKYLFDFEVNDDSLDDRAESRKVNILGTIPGAEELACLVKEIQEVHSKLRDAKNNAKKTPV